jgi:hypothetical protein
LILLFAGDAVAMSFLNQMTKELLKRYGRLVLGKPFAPAFLNILVTSVCDMRCIHCFFTEELDDKERKKNQMKTENIIRISETLGGNLCWLLPGVSRLLALTCRTLPGRFTRIIGSNPFI